MSAPISHDEILTAFRKYCDDRQPPTVSPESMGYIRHCLSKAARNAAIAGEEPTIAHHQLFVVMAHDVGHPELIPEFLTAIPPEEGANP